jgi:hypothetical protein
MANIFILLNIQGECMKKEAEPTLQGIEDYDTLKGDKKKVVWIIILVGLLLGALYAGAKVYYGNVSDSLPTSDSITKVPLK